jgi:hypothetical protein
MMGSTAGGAADRAIREDRLEDDDDIGVAGIGPTDVVDEQEPVLEWVLCEPRAAAIASLATVFMSDPPRRPRDEKPTGSQRERGRSACAR